MTPPLPGSPDADEVGGERGESKSPGGEARERHEDGADGEEEDGVAEGYGTSFSGIKDR